MDVITDLFFERVFNQSAACLLMLVVDAQVTVIAVSDKYLQLTGLRREELVGKNPFDVFPDEPEHPDGALTTRNAILEVQRTGKTIVIPDYLYHIRSPVTGKLEPFWWQSTFEPILNERGEVEIVLGTAVDQTARHQVRLDLDNAEQMLHLAVQAADIGTWNIDVETKEIVSSARSKALYGLPENEHTSLEGVLAAVHPEYRERVSAALGEAMASDGGQSYVIDYPVKGINDQQDRWLRSTARLFPETKMLCGTLVDITESKLLEQKKNDFIMMVSHEMKSPLTSITGYLDLVITKAKTPGDGFILNSLARARVQTQKLRKMINGFLDLAGVEQGQLNLNPVHFTFRELVNETLNELSIIDHQVVFEDGPDTKLFADRAQIAQVINNLLSNAVKYSPAGTKIELSHSILDNDLKVFVRDEGIGIAAQHQKKLFDRFFRVDRSARSKSGFGIGLYLAAEIVRNHGGTIGVNSEEGRGSEFWFTLPLNLPTNY